MKNLFLLLIIFTTCLFHPSEINAQPKGSSFLCVFMDGKAEDLRYCASTDGYHFTPVNNGNVILKSVLGGKIIRDPHIIQDRKGIYHLVATNSWKGRSFVIWDSKDLVTWKNERLIEASPADADKTWAPEAIFNEKDNNYAFYWTSSIDNQDNSWGIYYATTKDFIHFSAPAVLMRSDRIILDADIVKKADNRYVMFYRYENKIWKKEAEQLLGNYRDSSLVIDANVEGPFVYKTTPQKWNMIWDYYGGNQGKYGMAESADLIHWTWLTDTKAPYYNNVVSFPVGVRHGAVITISPGQLSAIMKRFPNSDRN